jgi:hypothetical protein
MDLDEWSQDPVKKEIAFFGNDSGFHCSYYWKPEMPGKIFAHCDFGARNLSCHLFYLYQEENRFIFNSSSRNQSDNLSKIGIGVAGFNKQRAIDFFVEKIINNTVISKVIAAGIEDLREKLKKALSSMEFPKFIGSATIYF